ncbi:alpha/beta fold hydrolase [Aquihabitans sp. G128]|uniref:alpha/beta fold hydrolase n=1 Tax=Aquihabitans sp. G128 TaxID=2849779 RepID=UPI00352D7C7F
MLADRVPTELLVLVTAVIARPGESAGDWWANTGHGEAFRAQATRDGIPLDEDPSDAHTYYQGVPDELVAGAEADVRGQSGTPFDAAWPLDAWPAVPTHVVLCTEDRFFPAPFMRELVTDRLDPATPVTELPAGHLPMLSHPTELAAILDRAWAVRRPSGRRRSSRPGAAAPGRAGRR